MKVNHLQFNPLQSKHLLPLKRSAKKIVLLPALVALFVQCAALLTVFILSFLSTLLAGVYFGADVSFSFLILVLMQALFAALFSSVLGAPIWWRWIHLCFPLAIWVMSSLYVPNEVYLFGFLISLSLFWTTFRTQVPFYPSRPIVWRQVAKIMPSNQTRPVRMIDIGSGLGDMSMYIAKHCPLTIVEGMEIAPLPWLISYLRARFTGSLAKFKLGDYQRLNFADYDAVFAYLSPAAMLSLWEKAKSEMQPGSLLISYEFQIPDAPPTFTISTGDNSPLLYVWKMDSFNSQI